jgi:hypothetical protein
MPKTESRTQTPGTTRLSCQQKIRSDIEIARFTYFSSFVSLLIQLNFLNADVRFDEKYNKLNLRFRKSNLQSNNIQFNFIINLGNLLLNMTLI